MHDCAARGQRYFEPAVKLPSTGLLSAATRLGGRRLGFHDRNTRSRPNRLGRVDLAQGQFVRALGGEVRNSAWWFLFHGPLGCEGM